jgi:uncharacterized OB-fold protein
MWPNTTNPVPQPEISEETEPYWEGCKIGELRVQRCTSCGTLRWYPRPMCSNCSSFDTEWVATSGKGKVVSWTVIHHIFNPAFADKVPYLVVIVELDEGPRFVSNLLNVAPEDVRENMRVEVEFHDVDGITMPYFRAV